MAKDEVRSLADLTEVGGIYLANISVESRNVKIGLVEVIAKYRSHVLCRTLVCPGEYGMSKSYNLSFYYDELYNRFGTVRAIRKWVLTTFPYSQHARALFGENNVNREKNKAIWDEELRRVARLLGDHYE